jgi:hypothetical protein
MNSEDTALFATETVPLNIHLILAHFICFNKQNASSRGHTCPRSPPICMEMIRKWSSSLHHTRNVLASLWYMPRPVGQKRHALAACKQQMKIL